jgi:cytoskeleton protein RodZ
MQEQSELLGGLLKQIRESKNLSIAQVADRLKLSISKIQALEADDETLMRTDIARGYLRSYARLLEIDDQQLLATHKQLFPQQRADIHVTTEALQKTVKRQRALKKGVRLVSLSAFLLVLCIAAGYLWYVTRATQADSAISNGQENMADSANEPAPLDKDKLVADVTAQSDQQEKSTDLVNQTGPVKQGQIEIKLVFSEQSWTSVRDVQGRSLYNKLAEANSQDVVSGFPPLKLIIGNVNGTKLYAHGKEVNLTQYTENNVAKLNLE